MCKKNTVIDHTTILALLKANNIIVHKYLQQKKKDVESLFKQCSGLIGKIGKLPARELQGHLDMMGWTEEKYIAAIGSAKFQRMEIDLDFRMRNNSGCSVVTIHIILEHLINNNEVEEFCVNWILRALDLSSECLAKNNFAMSHYAIQAAEKILNRYAGKSKYLSKYPKPELPDIRGLIKFYYVQHYTKYLDPASQKHMEGHPMSQLVILFTGISVEEPTTKVKSIISRATRLLKEGKDSVPEDDFTKAVEEEWNKRLRQINDEN